MSHGDAWSNPVGRPAWSPRAWNGPPPGLDRPAGCRQPEPNPNLGRACLDIKHAVGGGARKCLPHTPSDGAHKRLVINVSQILTLGKRFLAESAGMVPEVVLGQVEEGLQLVLGLRRQ